jgi:hypothetical protein
MKSSGGSSFAHKREREREQERDSNNRLLLQHKHEVLKKKIIHTRETDETDERERE